jgi:type II secretory ATPase GspE/PulE/Tfp pilus assembly ATPase PilB-like protein/GAF domain-containing protein
MITRHRASQRSTIAQLAPVASGPHPKRAAIHAGTIARADTNPAFSTGYKVNPRMDNTAPSSATISNAKIQLQFMQKLQTLATRIHATRNNDEIMIELAEDIRGLFNADRLTIYSVSPDRRSIATRVKTGLNSFKDFALPISPESIAGFVALNRQVLNIKDVTDAGELQRIDPGLRFKQSIDSKTGYKSREMLVAPAIDAFGDLQGVLQLINHLPGGPFPAIAEEGAQLMAQTLAVALAQRQPKVQGIRTRYDHLVSNAVISTDELELAVRAARRKDKDIETVLIEDFQVSLAAIGAALGSFFNLPYVPYSKDLARPTELLRNIKRDFVETNQWLPLSDDGKQITVVAPDPGRLSSARIQNILGRDNVALCTTTQAEYRKMVDLFFDQSEEEKIGDLISSINEAEALEDESIVEDLAAATDNELVRLVNKIIVDAHASKASDIHIEPYPGKQKIQVRVRKDGELMQYIEIPAAHRNAIVARIKIMSDLDISERRKPQDGKILFRKYGPVDIELRVATLPTANGMEDVVMRILASGEPLPLDKLGLSDWNRERLTSIANKPYGIFFVCGPTGSGKTTTLHSILGHINTPQRKIWTAEDPVEITQRGLRQVQINRRAGLDFSVIMRAFLRADPDVIMVGEMRDRETVATGIEASLTGHLVLSTLHTNSAPESVTRLLDMGMDPFNFSDALLGVLAQRLARRLCPACKESYTPDEEETAALLDEYALELRATSEWRDDPDYAMRELRAMLLEKYGKDKKFRLARARGCDACSGGGYAGRLGLHELMVGTDAVKRLVQQRAPVADLVATALEEGMRTLKMDGIEKVLQGLTDLKQIRQVCIK